MINPNGPSPVFRPSWDPLLARLKSSTAAMVYRSIVNRMRPWIAHGRLDTWICTGREAGSGEPFRLAYAGKPHNKHYITHMLFAEPIAHRHIGLIVPERLIAVAAHEGCDMIIAEVDQVIAPRLRAEASVRIPIWMPLRFALNGDSAVLQTGRALSDLRRHAKRSGLQYVFTQDRARLFEFYTELHRPFIAATHRDEVVVHPYPSVAKRLRDGELMMAFHDEEWIGGVMIEYSPLEGRLSFLGVKEAWARRGVISAILFQAMVRIAVQRRQIANLGDAHGFLKDGLLRYKANFGCHVSTHDLSAGRFWTLSVLRPSEATKRALIDHPCITIDETGAPWGLFVMEDPSHLEADPTIVKDSLCPGLCGVRVHRWTEQGCRLDQPDCVMRFPETVPQEEPVFNSDR